MTLLNVSGISKKFGGVQALRFVSFTVEPGQILGIIGPNGSGKTTLFNVISGLTPVDEGRISFAGTDITGWKPFRICRLGIGRTFQLVQPFPELTVYENVAVGALFGKAGWSSSNVRRDVLSILEFLGLVDKSGEPAGSLTLPDKKRLEVARAMATRPRLLLLDEVMAGLNPSEVDTFSDMVKGITRQGTTVMVIEHVMRAVMRLAERVLVLHHGQVIANGPPAAVVSDKAVQQSYLGEARARAT